MKFYDIEYLSQLRDLTRKYLNSTKVVLFSVDGCGPEYLRNGKIPGKHDIYIRLGFVGLDKITIRTG
jgi:hypothetical protein